MASSSFTPVLDKQPFGYAGGEAGEGIRVQIGTSHAATPRVGWAAGSLDWRRQMMASLSA